MLRRFVLRRLLWRQQVMSNGAPKKVVVVSDFRLFPTLVAIDLMLREPRAQLIISEAHLVFSDYGGRVRELRKRITVWILGLFFECEVVPERTTQSDNHSTCEACLTSLVSEERDSSADHATNPGRFSQLNRLCDGAETLLREIKARDITTVYLFNGRLASTRKIADGLRAGGSVQVQIYEWFTIAAGSSVFSYRLADYPIHSHSEAGSRMAQWRSLEGIRASSEVEQFIQSKLGSRHAVVTPASPGDKRFLSVLLPGTPHEFKWATVGEDEIDGNPEELVKRFLDHPAFLEPFVIRMHPNTAGARDEAEVLRKIESLITDKEGELIPPRSPVSSHELIKRSSRVFVGGSSVALDAYLLGKVPIFLGANTYRPLITALEKSDPGEEARRLKAVTLAHEFFLGQRRTFLPILRPLVLLHALNWRLNRFISG